MSHHRPFDDPASRDSLLIQSHCNSTIDMLISRPLPRKFVRAALAIFDAPGAPELTAPLFHVGTDGVDSSRFTVSALSSAAQWTHRMQRSRMLRDHFKINSPCVLEEICARLPQGPSADKDKAAALALLSDSPHNAKVLSDHGASLIGASLNGPPADSPLFMICAGQSNADQVNLWLDADDLKRFHEVRMELIARGLRELGESFQAKKADPTDWIPALMAACLAASCSTRGQEKMAKPHLKAVMKWAAPWNAQVDWRAPIAFESTHQDRGSVLYALTPPGWESPCSLAEMALQARSSSPEFFDLLAPLAFSKGVPPQALESLGASLACEIENSMDAVHEPLTSDSVSSMLRQALAAHAAVPALATAQASGATREMPKRDLDPESPCDFQPLHEPGWGSACALMAFGVHKGPKGFTATSAQWNAVARAQLLAGREPGSAHWGSFRTDFAQRAASRLALMTILDGEFDGDEDGEFLPFDQALAALSGLARAAKPKGAAELADATLAEMIRRGARFAQISGPLFKDGQAGYSAATMMASLGGLIDAAAAEPDFAQARQAATPLAQECLKILGKQAKLFEPVNRGELTARLESASLRLGTAAARSPSKPRARI